MQNRSVPFVAVCALLAASASAFEYNYQLDPATSSPTWPVMRVDFCVDDYAAQIPSVSSQAALGHLVSAANEWQTGSGADFRIRFGSVLSGACTTNILAIPLGHIEARAEPAFGGDPCDGRVGAGFARPSVQQTPIAGYFAIMGGTFEQGLDSAGNVICSASLPPSQRVYKAYAWSETYSTVGSVLFALQRWMTHEMGHGFGLSHEFDAPEANLAQMSYDSSDGLSVDDVFAVRTAAGDGLLDVKILEFNSSLGVRSSRSGYKSVGHYEFTDSAGSVTELFLAPRGGGTSEARLTNRVPWPYQTMSARTPAHATDGKIEVIAWPEVDNYTHDVRIGLYDGQAWTFTSLDDETTVSPTLTWFEAKKMFVLAYARAQTMQINIATSFDGHTWVPQGQLKNSRKELVTSDSFALNCNEQTELCTIVYSNASEPYSRIHVAEFGLNGVGTPSLNWNVALANGALEKVTTDSYGVDFIFETPDRLLVSWRDRGAASPLVVARVKIDHNGSAEVEPGYFVGQTIHAPPRIHRANDGFLVSAPARAVFNQ